MKLFFYLITMVMLSSCGSSPSSVTAQAIPEPSKDTQQEEPKEKDGLYMYEKVSDLPKCSADIQDKLAYVKSEATFKLCDGGSWGAIDLKGKDGVDGKDGENGSSSLNLTKKLFFHTDSYAIGDDVNAEGSSLVVIGDIRISEFDSGYALVSISGNFMTSDASKVYDFSHNFFMKLDNDHTGVAMAKISSYANYRNFYFYDSDTNILTVSVDTDGDIVNNPPAAIFNLATDNF